MKVKISHAQAVSEIQELDLSLETPRGKDCVIGRSPDADFVLDDPDVSRFHCKFFYQSGNYYFTDLGSRNGSIFNNKVIQKDQAQLLNNGDVIRVGDYVLVMEDTTSIEQPAETVVRIINPALFSQKPSKQNIEVGQPEAAINETPENIETPVVEEVNATDEAEIITPDINSASVEVNEVEIAQVQPEIEIPVKIEETLASESENIETNVAEIEESQAFAAPEYTIVQLKDVQLQEPEANSETSEDSSNDLLQNELMNETHVQERNLEEITNETEELTTPEIELVESEVSVTDNLEISIISKEDSTETTEETQDYQTTESEEIESTSEAEVLEILSEAEVLEVLEDISQVNVDITPGTEEPQESQVEEIQAKEASETTSESQLPAVITQKYTVLIAHDSKQSELVNFVNKHKELLSECLTMTWNSVSESLEQQAGINVSEEIPAATSGGYQRIASLINSNDILAVIFIRDLLQPQPGQANEETFLRLCNINEVLLATNLATAEAVVCYMKHGL